MRNMLLENLDLDQRSAAQEELEGLADDLRAVGFGVRVADEDGSVHARLQESAEQVIIDVINVAAFLPGLMQCR